MLLKAILAVALLAIAAPTIATAGPCNVPSDTASDGSRCGDRAASERPGGN